MFVNCFFSNFLFSNPKIFFGNQKQAKNKNSSQFSKYKGNRKHAFTCFQFQVL